MATLRLVGSTEPIELPDGRKVQGAVTINKRGDVIIKQYPGVPVLSLESAKAVLESGASARGSLYQAVGSIVLRYQDFITAGLDTDKPIEFKKQASDRIAEVFKKEGLSAEGRGNPAGPYRSVIAAFLAAGGVLEARNNMLPNEKMLRVAKERDEDEMADDMAKRIAAAFKTADDNGVLKLVISRINALSGGQMYIKLADTSKVVTPDEEKEANQAATVGVAEQS
jgi:hypothetical protein